MRRKPSFWHNGIAILAAAALCAPGCRSDVSALETEASAQASERTEARPAGPRAAQAGFVDRLTAPLRQRTATLPAGTRLSVRLEERIDSDNNHAGDRFRATLLSELSEAGVLLAPAGTPVVGEITHVKEAGEVKGRAELEMALREIEIDGRWHDFDSEPVFIRAKGTKKDDAIKVGAGAAVGAVLGGILDGDDGAAKGAAIGAGSGLGYVLLTEGKDVEYEPGATFQFSLRQAVELPVSETDRG